MEENFVPYSIAKLLKEKGFNDGCFGYWSNHHSQEPFLLSCEFGNEQESCSIRRKNFLCSAPIYQQAIAWFRKRGIGIVELTTTNPLKWVITHNGEFKGAYEIDKALEEAIFLNK